MHRTTTAVVTALTVLALAACSSTSSADTATQDVPAGVATMYSTVAEEIADRGGETTAGEWRIGYIVEAAEPWFEKHGQHSSFREPRAGETHHIEIIPFEKSTGRIVPSVPIHVEVVDAQGAVVDEKDLNFYYATFFHYANNFDVPESGAYTLRATLGAPTFLRHGDEAEGPALAEGATVEFDDVELSSE